MTRVRNPCSLSQKDKTNIARFCGTKFAASITDNINSTLLFHKSDLVLSEIWSENMKGILILLSAALMIGCAEIKTLEELEFAAIQTGDWSAVEKRERAVARRQARNGPSCPDGQVAVCENRGNDSQCRCMSRQSMRDILGHL